MKQIVLVILSVFTIGCSVLIDYSSVVGHSRLINSEANIIVEFNQKNYNFKKVETKNSIIKAISYDLNNNVFSPSSENTVTVKVKIEKLEQKRKMLIGQVFATGGGFLGLVGLALDAQGTYVIGALAWTSSVFMKRYHYTFTSQTVIEIMNGNDIIYSARGEGTTGFDQYLFSNNSIADEYSEALKESMESIKAQIMSNKDFINSQLIKEAPHDIDQISEEDIMNNNVDPNIRVTISKEISVDEGIPKTQMYQPDAVAVVIGNKDYEIVPDIDYAINDAKTIKTYLINTLGFKENNISLMENISKTDFEETFGTSEFAIGRLYRMIRPEVSDVFIFYSGHGAPGLQNQKGYFVPVECDPSYLEFRGYSLDVFYENLSKLPAKSVTVVVDACFSGENVHQNISSIVPKVKDPVFKLPHGILLSSSQATEPSSWFGERQHGLFTYFFLRAIKDKENSDTNGDGKLTFQEIYDYISTPTQGVPNYARRLHGREQHLTIQGDSERVFVEF